MKLRKGPSVVAYGYAATGPPAAEKSKFIMTEKYFLYRKTTLRIWASEPLDGDYALFFEGFEFRIAC